MQEHTPKSGKRRWLSFWSAPDSKKQKYETVEQREIDVSKILKDASENKDAFESAIDGVCLMIMEKIQAGKRIEENFSSKIQSIIEGLRKLAWPKDQTNYTSTTCTTTDPKKWIETLEELKGSSWRVNEDKLSHRQS